MEFVEVEPAQTLAQKLLRIQQGLTVGKNRYNEFGGYYSRSKEDILEAVKPLAHELGCVVLCDDQILSLGDDWTYVQTTATLMDAVSGETIKATAQAREPVSRAKMDASQLTGSAASYAGKRALGNLFAIDDTKDADQAAPEPEPGKVRISCVACGKTWKLDSAMVESKMADFTCTQCGGRHAKVG